MTFRIDLNGHLGDEVRRITHEQLSKARAEIAGGRSNHHDAIHDVRKRCKKLRALVRLVRDASPDMYARTNAKLRDGARLLSAMRDAQAMVETCDVLAEHAMGVEHTALARARIELVARRDDEVLASAAHERLIEIGRVLARVDRAASEWPLDSLDGSHLVAGAVRTYRRGRRALADSGGPADAEGLHEVRKRAKYARFEHRLLEDLAPRPMEAARADLAELAALLGQHHDLAVFDEHLPAIAIQGADRRSLERLLQRRRRSLYDRAIDLARQTFAERVAMFRERLEAYVDVDRQSATESRAA